MWVSDRERETPGAPTTTLRRPPDDGVSPRWRARDPSEIKAALAASAIHESALCRETKARSQVAAHKEGRADHA